MQQHNAHMDTRNEALVARWLLTNSVSKCPSGEHKVRTFAKG